MDKFRNKYRIASARASWWNYGWNGAYFITICTKNRYPFFGEIENGAMKLSHQGIMADILWHQIPYHAQHIELGAFVVMPNHIHGILILNDLGNGDSGGSNNSTESNVETGPVPVEAGHTLSLHQMPLVNPTQSPAQSRFQNQGKNTISAPVRVPTKRNGLVCEDTNHGDEIRTKNANRLGLELEWQTRFYDNLIRTDADYQRIKNYIETNPENWKDDKFFTN